MLSGRKFRAFELAVLVFLMFSAGCGAVDDAEIESAETRPNILLILADDMGYTDLGSFGGEIATPNLDSLAYGGLRFTNFHVGPSCAPTRGMLMSGTTSVEAGVLGLDVPLLTGGRVTARADTGPGVPHLYGGEVESGDRRGRQPGSPRFRVFLCTGPGGRQPFGPK